MKKIGIGYENYKEFMDQDLYYVDKTFLIRDIVLQGGKVTLFTRPRRFGKTLVLSMMGQYPVIILSLKSAKQPRFFDAFMMLRDEIISEYERHDYLRGSDRLKDTQRRQFEELRGGYIRWLEKSEHFQNQDERMTAFHEEVVKYAAAIKTLCECLRQHHGKNVIILIDEYDVPLENAYYSGFYNEMVGFICSVFESALKTNDALERAVITGCLRIMVLRTRRRK